MLTQIARKFLFVFALTLLLVPGASAQDELTDLRFFLSFIPNVQFSPVYVAAAKGYFEEEGYNLLIEHGDENIGVEQIAVGDIPFGLISGEQVILARANGRPIVYVYEWFQKYPIAIVIPSTTEAKTLPELRGMRVGIPGRFGATYSGLTALLAANEMTETDLQIEVIGFNAPDVVCAGAIDASVVYINNEPLQIQERADRGECGDITGVSVIPVANTANMVSNGVATSEQMIAENPEQVNAVNRAFDSGLRDVINNPAEAYLVSMDYVENLPISDEFRAALEEASAAQVEFLADAPDMEAITQSRADLLSNLEEQFDPAELSQFRVLLATIDLWVSEDNQPGLNNEEAWTLTQDTLLQMGMMPEAIDLSKAYTDEFVPMLEETE
jgi:NitT/TauT family transport system substrate-binding protein